MQFQLYVSCFEPEIIHVTGSGTCALVTLASATEAPALEADLRAALVRYLDQYDSAEDFRAVDPGLVRHTLQSPVVDLGDLVRGTQRKKTVELRNVGDLSLSLDVDKSQLVPFRLDPLRVVGLAPAQSVRCTVTYVGGAGASAGGGRAKAEPLGEARALVRAVLGGGVLGPALTLNCCANVTLPDLQLSSDCVDFGPIPVGFLARRYVRITNPTRVDCEW